MSYTVRPGDTLSAIANRFHVSLSSLEHANSQVKNPNMIYVGEKLTIPGQKDTFQHAKPPAHHKPTHHKPAPKPAPKHHAGSTGSSTYGEPWKRGPGQLRGGDTSHYQSASTFESSIAGKQFAAIKATEGTGYTDPSFRARWNELGHKIQQGKMKLRVAYLFLDKGNGAGQAKHFLSALGIHGKLQPGTRLALDWEASALSSPQTLKDAANYIHKVTGLWPLIYTSASQAARAKAAVPGAPMWLAQWTGGLSRHDVPFVQYSDGPGYDHDAFNGDLKALERFAGWIK